jgi:hypothetical protein
MAKHAVGNQVVLTGTIVELEGDVALVQVDRSYPSGTTTIAVRLGKLPDDDAEMLRRHGVERCAICGVVLRSHAGGDHPWTQSEEDKIREAMRLAQENPGRTVTVE